MKLPESLKTVTPFSKLLALLLFILLLFAGFYLGMQYQKFIGANQMVEEQTPDIRAPQIAFCTRTTRLKNEPQYDRALSLIQQRIDENNKWWDEYGEKANHRFRHFTPELVNCIKITEESIEKSAGIEGYFTFNSKDTTTDYYPITVSSDYNFADDIVTALLLSHEITHVQQYIDTLDGKNTLSCIDSEIDAFIAQLDFYVTLNSEEINSVYYRIQGDENLHSQLQILDWMMTTNRDSSCLMFDLKDYKNCSDANLTNELKKMLTENSYYRKQCGLD